MRTSDGPGHHSDIPRVRALVWTLLQARYTRAPLTLTAALRNI